MIIIIETKMSFGSRHQLKTTHMMLQQYFWIMLLMVNLSWTWGVNRVLAIWHK